MVDVEAAAKIADQFLLSVPDQDRLDAVALLDELGAADADALAMRLAQKLWQRPPEKIGRPLTQVQLLSLVVTMIKGRAIDRTVDPTDDGRVDITAELVRNQVRGVYETRQQAAAAAIGQLGGAKAFGVPYFLEADLNKTGHTASRDTLDSIAHIADVGHHWHFPDVHRVGFVLYSINDR